MSILLVSTADCVIGIFCQKIPGDTSISTILPGLRCSTVAEIAVAWRWQASSWQQDAWHADGWMIMHRSVRARVCVVAGLGPSRWAEQYTACGGYKQSPINIELANATRKDDFAKLELAGHATGFELTNNGHTGTGVGVFI